MQGIIATVIIAVIATALALVVAYFVVNIAMLYSKVELFEIQSIYVTRLSNGTYKISFSMMNKGTQNIIIDTILINNKPIEEYNSSFSTDKKNIKPGEKVEVNIFLNLSPGTAVEIAVTTNMGVKHVATVRLS